MKSIKLTIAVAIYNVENYLEKCLESLLNQTKKNGYEILLINDGSKDNSLTICENYLKKGLKAEIITKENEGLISVRNLSIQLARGEYILFLDGDDFIEENTIEIIMNEITENDLLVFGFYWINNNFYTKDKRFIENKVYCSKEKIKDLVYMDKINTSVWNKIFRVSILRENNIKFLNFYKCEDIMFNIEYLKKCHRVKIIKNVLYNYIFRDDSLSNIKDIYYYINYLNLYSVLLSQENEKNQIFWKYFLTNYIYLIRDIEKNEYLRKNEEILNKRKNIEKKIKILKVIFNNEIKLRTKIRYLKIIIK